MSMRTYYRIQPAGFPVSGHRSETSEGAAADGLHVFTAAYQTIRPDGMHPETYGDEVVILSAGDYWSNGDVEGVCIDGDSAQLVARIALADWLALWEECDESQHAFDAAIAERFGVEP